MYKNADDQRRCWREWYRRNSKKEVARRKARKKRIQQWLAAYKAKLQCNRCPESHPACLDFHHRDGSKKKIAISRIVMTGWSIARILKEIAKCEVVCSNCHRKIHFRRLSSGLDACL